MSIGTVSNGGVLTPNFHLQDLARQGCAIRPHQPKRFQITPGMPFWFGVLIYMIIAFPVSLWVGYVLGRCFQAMDS